MRPFDDEIPAAAIGSLDLDSLMNTTTDEKKEYKIGKTKLDKISYDEIHLYDTYEKAMA